MKKVVSISTVILFLLYTILPVAKLVAVLKKYDISLHGSLVTACVLSGLSLLVTIGLLIWQERMTSRVDLILSAFSSLLFPFAFIHWAVCIPLCDWSLVIIILAVVCLVCFAILLFRSVQPVAMKIISSILALLVALPVALWVLISPVVGSFGSADVTAELESPNGAYAAQAIYEDRGIFGAKTYVKVLSKEVEKDLLLLSFTKSPVKITGEWSEKDDALQMQWKDNETLLINGKAYSVTGDE